MKKTIIFFVIGAAVAIAIWTGMKSNESVKLVNTTGENVAVKGFDTVAYFTQEKPLAGKAEIAHEWNGAKWYFASEENKELFAANPEKYAPQFGGYCSWAVSHGYTADGDPQAWKIVGGKLYLNYNLQVKEKWETEQEKLIEIGEKNWTEFKKKKPEHK